MNNWSFPAGAEILIDWFIENARPLPWRTSPPDPYRVWVSEVMLQQTRIEAVIPYFHRFMEVLPDTASLAAAGADALYKLWEGLGYYRRVTLMQQAAVRMMELHGGRFPETLQGLRALPGIGAYIAGALGSIAFGIPEPAVDGNVLRVMARLSGCARDVTTSAAAGECRTALRAAIPKDRPGEFNQALMELGQRICTPGPHPGCARCPMCACCTAYMDGLQSRLPVRSPKKERRIEEKTVLVIVDTTSPLRVLLHKRGAPGLLAGFWELPLLDGHATSEDAAVFLEALGLSATRVAPLPRGRHLFTHIEWRLCGYLLHTAANAPPKGYAWATLAQMTAGYAVPAAYRTYTSLLPLIHEKPFG